MPLPDYIPGNAPKTVIRSRADYIPGPAQYPKKSIPPVEETKKQEPVSVKKESKISNGGIQSKSKHSKGNRKRSGKSASK